MKLKLDWENVFRPIEEVVVEFVGFEELGWFLNGGVNRETTHHPKIHMNDLLECAT